MIREKEQSGSQVQSTKKKEVRMASGVSADDVRRLVAKLKGEDPKK